MWAGNFYNFLIKIFFMIKIADPFYKHLIFLIQQSNKTCLEEKFLWIYHRMDCQLCSQAASECLRGMLRSGDVVHWASLS